MVLLLNEGTFSGFKPGSDNTDMNDALAKFFKGLKDGYELYTLGTLDTNNATLLAS